MSKLKDIILPPENIMNPPLGKNYEYIILWMLCNNDICGWSDFTQIMSESTLSGYLRRFINKEQVEKIKKGQYKIKKKGIKRYNNLQHYKETGKRNLKYTPSIILSKRNYDDVILWMVYNNTYCKWSDFREEPLQINQSSLSKNINLLMDRDYIKNENKKYKITTSGKNYYLEMLKKYDLDRQSILEEESKRIEEITKKTIKFFEKYEIIDNEIKFRFLNNILKLNHAKIKNTLPNEEDFKKILLFLSINHPDNYPEYISVEKFSNEYECEIRTLQYYIFEIVENNIYPIKFFKLELTNEKTYYFHANERFEKILRTIVEDNINKFTYLNKLYENNKKDTFSILDKADILNNILDELCVNLIDENFKTSLSNFLPSYINYLAYKIETESKLTNPLEKLEGITWQHIPDVFRTFDFSETRQHIDQNEFSYYLDPKIFEVLEIYFISKLDILSNLEFKKDYFQGNEDFIKEIEIFLIKGKILKAKKNAEKKQGELTELGRLIVNDIICTLFNNFDESLRITSKIIEKYPRYYVGYLLQSNTLFLMNKHQKSLEIIEKGFKNNTNEFLIYQKIQNLIKINKSKEAILYLNKSFSNSSNNKFTIKLKLLSIIYGNCSCEDNQRLKNFDLNSLSTDINLLLLKSILLCREKKYKEAKKLLYQEISFNAFIKNSRIDISAFFILIFCNLARGKFEKSLEIKDKMKALYPNHPISFLSEVLILGYNLIYNFSSKQIDLAYFLEIFGELIGIDPIKSNQSRYYQFKSYILQGLKHNDKALEAINIAIDLEPYKIDLYYSKNNICINTEQEEKAIAILDNLFKEFPQNERDIQKSKSFILYKMKRYDEGLEIAEELLEKFPEDDGIMNNQAIMLANLYRKEEAIETARKLISLFPKVGNYHDSYGEILMMFDDFDEAIKEFEIALELEPNGFFAYQAYLKMGECYQEIGSFDRAEECFFKGKLLTDRLMPGERNIYARKADNYLSDIKKLKKL